VATAPTRRGLSLKTTVWVRREGLRWRDRFRLVVRLLGPVVCRMSTCCYIEPPMGDGEKAVIAIMAFLALISILSIGVFACLR
jgi:hypothetical protein